MGFAGGCWSEQKERDTKVGVIFLLLVPFLHPKAYIGRKTYKQEVAGSNPALPTIHFHKLSEPSHLGIRSYPVDLPGTLGQFRLLVIC